MRDTSLGRCVLRTLLSFERVSAAKCAIAFVFCSPVFHPSMTIAEIR